MIVAAAIRQTGILYALPAPARHHDILHQSGADGAGLQGFIDSEYGFVDRQDAWLLATRAGQLLDRAPTDGRGGVLYSEDVW